MVYMPVNIFMVRNHITMATKCLIDYWKTPREPKPGNAISTLIPRQNGRRFADDDFKYIFLNENVCISLKISLKFFPKFRINSILALVQIMPWRRPGDKPLSESIIVILSTHIFVTQPQIVNCYFKDKAPHDTKEMSGNYRENIFTVIV